MLILGADSAALKEKRPIHVLSIGSSSAGLGASTSYPVKLENALEQALPDVQVEVEARGLPGEVASGAGERLRSMVAEMEPDLVVWQVGTNDALARVALMASRTNTMLSIPMLFCMVAQQNAQF